MGQEADPFFRRQNRILNLPKCLGLFKRENLTKKWFGQGTVCPQRRGDAQPPTQIFLKWIWPKDGVHPKHSAKSFLHSPSICYSSRAFNGSSFSGLQNKIHIPWKAHQALHVSAHISTLVLSIACFPSCFLYASPSAIYHVPQMLHEHPPRQFLQLECSPPCHHLCPPKTHLFIGQGLAIP